MKDYTNAIVYNELIKGNKIYYLVKSFDGQVLRIEQLKTQLKGNIDEAINLKKLHLKDGGTANERENLSYILK